MGMKWKDFVADYLHFTYRERVAILVLIALIIVVFLAPGILPSDSSSTPSAADTSWIAALRQLEQKEPEYEENGYRKQPGKEYNLYDRTKWNSKGKKRELFYFDPNTVSAEEWERLGLREKTFLTVQNYLSKGGRFRKAEDVKRIYGLFPDEYERIAPYIQINAEREPGNPARESSYPAAENKPVKTYTPNYRVIDINTADTTAFISLPGIGSKISARIISFRDKLGGFYSIEQVAETFGLPDSTFQKIKTYMKLENISVRKININTATVDELKTHPYIRYALANPIVAYRNEHGPFEKVEDIKKIMAVTGEVFMKIVPYLTIEK